MNKTILILLCFIGIAQSQDTLWVKPTDRNCFIQSDTALSVSLLVQVDSCFSLRLYSPSEVRNACTAKQLTKLFEELRFILGDQEFSLILDRNRTVFKSCNDGKELGWKR